MRSASLSIVALFVVFFVSKTSSFRVSVKGIPKLATTDRTLSSSARKLDRERALFLHASASRTTMAADMARHPWRLPEGHDAQSCDKIVKVFAWLDKHPIRAQGTKMEYEPLEIMKKRTQREFVNTPAFELEPSHIPSKGGSEHYQRLVCAVLQLACGGLDECHNIITPLSWDSYTLFGGQPIENSPARHDATLLHHLVHLREGEHQGEFGTGWQNSGFWAGTLGHHAVLDQAHAAAMEISRGNPRLEQIMQGNFANGSFKPSTFLGMCRTAVANKDVELLQFSSNVENALFRLAFEHVYAKL